MLVFNSIILNSLLLTNFGFLDPPKISPFMFSTELTEGSSVQVLCGVSSGDKPMYFSWFKDGSPLPPNLQVICCFKLDFLCLKISGY